MDTIRSQSLQVTVLDPVADRDRMGPRYCTGGYVFQVADDGGPLLSGPTYPDDFNWFDGQGIPDSFALAPLRDRDAPSSKALIPGIGVCDTVERTVIEHCDWEIERLPERVRFRTTHAWGGYGLSIEREVSVAGRVVVSSTRVENRAASQLPVCWFPHPFYPLPAGAEICSLPAPVALPPGTTYSAGEDGYLRCRDFSAMQSVAVACNGAGPLTVLERHPRLGVVAARFSFPAAHVLVWGNPRTFSFEPYLERTVGVGAAIEWTAEYHF